ncbi:MAG: CBS domain-containing protein [Planctomycetia bacterium]|nr:CBS domain-containing protein [Planctomycetia bacterium]
MNAASPAIAPPRLVLRATTAADLMIPNPLSLREDAAVQEAVVFLVEKGYSAAPVIDKAGRPVGVLSRADIVVHDREKIEYVGAYRQYAGTAGAPEPLGRGFQVENVDPARVRDVMTPVVFSVNPETPVQRVVENLLRQRVHRLFVVDGAGVLVGVISTVDVLRHLHAEEE